MARRSVVIGANRVRRKLRRIEPEARNEVGKVIKTEAEHIVATAKELVPKVSHDLERAIKSDVARDQLSGIIGFSKKRRGFKALWKLAGWRAHFVEFGTAKMTARPFLLPAFRAHKDKARRDIRKAMSIMLDRVSRGG